MVHCLVSHENILPFVGMVEGPNSTWLISVWMENGEITEYIKAERMARREAPKAYLVSQHGQDADSICNRNIISYSR